MDSTFSATHAALQHYDAVDRPAFEARRKCAGPSVDITGFYDARKGAADKVRAAFVCDIGDHDTEENVELMSVERIRKLIGGTILGRMLKLLP